MEQKKCRHKNGGKTSNCSIKAGSKLSPFIAGSKRGKFQTIAQHVKTRSWHQARENTGAELELGSKRGKIWGSSSAKIDGATAKRGKNLTKSASF